MRARVGAAAALVALTAGCGSTAQITSSTTGSGELGAVPQGLAGGTADLASGASEGGPSTSPGGDGATAATATAGPAGPGSSATGPSRVTATTTSLSAGGARGVTKTTIKLGIGTADDAAAFADALGIKGAAAGDTRAQIAAVVADINKHGGILGRKVVPVIHDYNTAQLASNPSAADNAACARWTQDDPVFAVLGGSGALYGEFLVACLAKTNTPLIAAGGIEVQPAYKPFYEKWRNFIGVGSMEAGRRDRIAIRRQVERGYYTPWDTATGAEAKPGPTGALPEVKLGMVSSEGVSGDAEVASRVPLLRKAGIKTIVVRCPGDVSGTIRCQQSAQLRFRSEGVTHVWGVGVTFFANADSQRYYPRYFIDQAFGVIAATSSPKALAGSMGESLTPAQDLPRDQDPGLPTSASRHCVKVMEQSGQHPDDQSVLWAMEAVCDYFYPLKAALESSRTLTTDGLRTGFESLGSTVPVATTWGTFFSPEEHASGTILRDVEYHEACSCYAVASRADQKDLQR